MFHYSRTPGGGSNMGIGFSMVGGLVLLVTAALEPSVNRQEQELIQAAVRGATTNAASSITALREQNSAESSAALDFVLGNLHFQQEQWSEAEAAYRAALTKLPTFRRAVVNLGHVQMRQDKAGAATDVLSEWLEQGQADAELFLLLGQAFVAEARFVSGESAFRQALLMASEDSDARLGLAKCLLEQGRHQEAAALLDELLASDPASVELWSLKANLYIAMDQADDAVAAIEAADRLGAASSALLATLGDLYINRQQGTDALRAYQRAFAEQGSPTENILRAAEGFLMLQDPARAREMLTRMPPAPVVNRDQLVLEASIARLEGDVDVAREAYDDLLAKNPLDGKALLALAELEAESSAWERAALTFERAARVAGFEAPALVGHARVEIQRGDYARAVRLLESSLTFEDSERVSRYLEQVRRLAALEE